MARYGCTWSDNKHEFGEPRRLHSKEQEKAYKFPDIVLHAQSMAEARSRIRIINRANRYRPREEFNI